MPLLARPAVPEVSGNAIKPMVTVGHSERSRCPERAQQAAPYTGIATALRPRNDKFRPSVSELLLEVFREFVSLRGG